jgi:hypothetical protein
VLLRISREHETTAVADPRQEHKHLGGRRVLALVDDDEGVAERPTPHVRQRTDLNRPALHEPFDFILLKANPQRVDDGEQPNTHLVIQRPWQKTQLLVSAHCWSGQNQAIDLTVDQLFESYQNGA